MAFHSERINHDIQRTVSSLLRGVKDPRVNQGMLSVTGAETTGDLKFCKIYLSSLGSVDERELLRGLKSASGFLRRELARALSLRNTPELTFVIDHSIEHGAHINSLIADLYITPETEEANDD
ncbi:MAG: 30S ribosome-binding factor RbfA [Oscillospiraceae bacterium]|jgi:ribosome-binding factor A|nr:30S ribosome-binding factor RbfA [Oscillospiraceae bacterium]